MFNVVYNLSDKSDASDKSDVSDEAAPLTPET